LFNWAPESEKSRMISFVICGCYFGTVITNLASGTLATSYGWSSIFYVFGGIGIIWCVVWILIVRRTPELDRWITKKEKEYILNNVSPNVKEELNIPWMKIFTNVPVWAIAIAHTCFNWGFYTFLTQLPMYLKGFLIM
jgi:MFS family permease